MTDTLEGNFMPEQTYPATVKLKAVDRELGYRRRVFPRRVEAQQMTQATADEQIAIFEDIRRDYERLAAKERLL